MTTTAANTASANRFQPRPRMTQKTMPPSSRQVRMMVVLPLVRDRAKNCASIRTASPIFTKSSRLVRANPAQKSRLTISSVAQMLGWPIAKSLLPSQYT